MFYSFFLRFLDSEENARVLVEWLKLNIVMLGLPPSSSDDLELESYSREIYPNSVAATEQQSLIGRNEGDVVGVKEASCLARIGDDEPLDNGEPGITSTGLGPEIFEQLNRTALHSDNDSRHEEQPEAIHIPVDSSIKHRIFGDVIDAALPSDFSIQIGDLTLEEPLDDIVMTYDEINSAILITEDDNVDNSADGSVRHSSKSFRCEDMDFDNDSLNASHSKSSLPVINVLQLNSGAVVGSLFPSIAPLQMAKIPLEKTVEEVATHEEYIRTNPFIGGSRNVDISGTSNSQTTASFPRTVPMDEDDAELDGDQLDFKPNHGYESDRRLYDEHDDYSIEADDDGGASPLDYAIESTSEIHLIHSVSSWDIVTDDAAREEPVQKKRGTSTHPIKEDLVSRILSWTGLQDQYRILEDCNALFRLTSSLVDGINLSTDVEQSHSSLVDLHNQFRDIADISALVSGEPFNCITNSSLTQLSTICQLMRTCAIQLPAIERHAKLNVKFYRTHLTQVYLQLYHWIFNFGPDLAQHLWESCEAGWTLGLEYDTLHKVVISIYDFVKKSSQFEGRTLSIYAGETAPLTLDGKGCQINLQVEYPKLSKRKIFKELFMQAIYVIVIRPNLPSGSGVGKVKKQQDGLAVTTYICNVFYSCFGSLAFALTDDWEEVLRNPLNIYEKVNAHRPKLCRLARLLTATGAPGLKSLLEAVSSSTMKLSLDSSKFVSFDPYSNHCL